MTRNKMRMLKLACYFSNISMSIVGNLPPLLFLTFRELYGISYSKLGLLVLVNFVTQLIVDLIFSFFSHKFNITKTVKLMPVLTVVGLAFYAVSPILFPRAVYAGLVIGTVIFSAAAGLGEVLISPVIAALPSPDPDREMSKLHSIYAWGVVGVIPVATVFLLLFGKERWQILAALFALIPLVSAFLFASSEIPTLRTEEKTSGALAYLKDKRLWACVFAIFLGGAAECTMAQWSSGYLEAALGIEKVWGDILGVTFFAAMLGLGRTLYSKIGKNMGRVLVFGAVGATLCYLTASVFNIAAVGLVACGLCGFCVSMLWPGNLVVATDRFPAGGVFIFAMMAAGGDLGASVGPQLVGVITDFVMESDDVVSIASSIGLTTEQLGMKAGLLVGMLFPLAAIPLYLFMHRRKSSKQ